MVLVASGCGQMEMSLAGFGYHLLRASATLVEMGGQAPDAGLRSNTTKR